MARSHRFLITIGTGPSADRHPAILLGFVIYDLKFVVGICLNDDRITIYSLSFRIFGIRVDLFGPLPIAHSRDRRPRMNTSLAETWTLLSYGFSRALAEMVRVPSVSAESQGDPFSSSESSCSYAISKLMNSMSSQSASYGPGVVTLPSDSDFTLPLGSVSAVSMHAASPPLAATVQLTAINRRRLRFSSISKQLLQSIWVNLSPIIEF